MSYSFWANVIFCAASLVGMLLNHTDLVEEIREETNPSKRVRKKWGLGVLWFVTILSIVALPVTAWESIKSEETVNNLSSEVGVATNRLNIAESNSLVLRTNIALLELSAKARHITPKQRRDLISCIKQWSGDKGPIFIQYHSTFGGVDEAHAYFSEIAPVIQEAGCFGTSATNLDVRRFAIPYSGVSLIVRDASNPPPFAIALKTCLANNGVAATAIRDGLLDLKNFETNIVILWIGQKPFRQ